MEAKLPARLGQHGRGHTLFRLYVGDDMDAESKYVDSIMLRILLSDPNSKNIPLDRCVAPALANRPMYSGEPNYTTMPIAKKILPNIKVRLNNIPLGRADVKAGWLIFPVKKNQLALGDNLVGIWAVDIPGEAADRILVERLELDVVFRDNPKAKPK